MARKRKKAKPGTGTKYAVNLMLTLDGRAPIGAIKASVQAMLEGMRIHADARSNGPSKLSVRKVTIRSVDED